MWRFLKRVEETLDDYGRPAWLALMVASLILVWPIGLAVLGYMIWSGRMGSWKSSGGRGCGWSRRKSPDATGNTAFDAYRDATLKRLEEEREAFSAFLEQLRRAKDQAEFDQFMANRNGADPSQNGAPTPQPAS
ncbi:MAG: DUF2852 domain-containing protein [Pseudomonadota bacterium]